MKEIGILSNGETTIIINGGNSLPGCPENWDVAHEWEAVSNKEKDEDEQPRWKFDCGFKLDYDGPLVSVESRFYPPKTHYGPTWDGNVTISILGKELITKAFDCKTLDELRTAVEAYINEIAVNRLRQMELFR